MVHHQSQLFLISSHPSHFFMHLVFSFPSPPIDLLSKRSTLTSSLFFGLWQKNKGGRLVGAVWSFGLCSLLPLTNQPAGLSSPHFCAIERKERKKKKRTNIKRIDAATTANREAGQLRPSSIHERQVEGEKTHHYDKAASVGRVYGRSRGVQSCGADTRLNETADFNYQRRHTQT